jgi:hypothetical protein
MFYLFLQFPFQLVARHEKLYTSCHQQSEKRIRSQQCRKIEWGYIKEFNSH